MSSTDSVFVMDAGDISAEDPHHGALLRLHAGEAAQPLPVAVSAAAHGWSHSGAGT